MKRATLGLTVLSLLLIAGCAEYKEFKYETYQVSREDAYLAVEAQLARAGYEIVVREESLYEGLPEIYLETSFNTQHADHVYKGNSVRRKAYVRIITRFSDRGPDDFQPLRPEDGKTEEELKKDEEARRKRAATELTTIGIAVRLERRSDVARPLESEWVYEGPDNLTRLELHSRLEVALRDRHGGIEPSARSMKNLKRYLDGHDGE